MSSPEMNLAPSAPGDSEAILPNESSAQTLVPNSSISESNSAAITEADAGSDVNQRFGLPIRIEQDHSVAALIREADRSAGKLVNLLATHFACFRDETRFEGRKVRLLKRAQIFAADVWAAFNASGLGEFDDIDQLTMFAGESTAGFLPTGGQNFTSREANLMSNADDAIDARLPCASAAASVGRPAVQSAAGELHPQPVADRIWPLMGSATAVCVRTRLISHMDAANQMLTPDAAGAAFGQWS